MRTAPNFNGLTRHVWIIYVITITFGASRHWWYRERYRWGKRALRFDESKPEPMKILFYQDNGAALVLPRQRMFFPLQWKNRMSVSEVHEQKQATVMIYMLCSDLNHI